MGAKHPYREPAIGTPTPVTIDDPNPASNCSIIKTALVPRIQK